MPAVLTPALTALDERVLALLSTDVARRARQLAKTIYGHPAVRCEACGRQSMVGGVSERARKTWEQRAPSRCAPWGDGCGGRERALLIITDEHAREIREILRGLERVGKARQRGGWWRAS